MPCGPPRHASKPLDIACEPGPLVLPLLTLVPVRFAREKVNNSIRFLIRSRGGGGPEEVNNAATDRGTGHSAKGSELGGLARCRREGVPILSAHAGNLDLNCLEQWQVSEPAGNGRCLVEVGET